jgi:hypothetical protein
MRKPKPAHAIAAAIALICMILVYIFAVVASVRCVISPDLPTQALGVIIQLLLIHTISAHATRTGNQRP